MKHLVAFGLVALSSATLAQPRASAPTPIAAAEAYVAYETNVCRALIDVCEGVGKGSPPNVQKLVCRPGSGEAALCRFEAQGHVCDARFRRTPSTVDGWSVAFRNKVPKGPDIRCK